MARSYTTENVSWVRVLKTGRNQLREILAAKRNAAEHMAGSLAYRKWFKTSAESLAGMTLRGKRTLEVGHGQMPLAAAYVAALGNESHGIDLDITPKGLLDVAGFIRMLRVNGGMRTLKTFVREFTGVNRALRREFVRQMGLREFPRMDLRYGDAANINFPDDSFDFVYSFNVFEHLADPESAIAEIMRVLRPGGTMWLLFPHYAHVNALHDMRWITRSEGAPPPWAHLVPEKHRLVEQGASINTLRIADWQNLFDRTCGNVKYDRTPMTDRRIEGWLSRYRESGELQDYSDEELLTAELIVVWQKPC